MVKKKQEKKGVVPIGYKRKRVKVIRRKTKKGDVIVSFKPLNFIRKKGNKRKKVKMR